MIFGHLHKLTIGGQTYIGYPIKLVHPMVEDPDWVDPYWLVQLLDGRIANVDPDWWEIEVLEARVSSLLKELF